MAIQVIDESDTPLSEEQVEAALAGEGDSYRLYLVSENEDDDGVTATASGWKWSPFFLLFQSYVGEDGTECLVSLNDEERDVLVALNRLPQEMLAGFIHFLQRIQAGEVPG